MESANHHQHQDQLGGSSSFAVPSLGGAGTNHLWNQTLLLNGGNFDPNANGLLSNSRDLRQNHDILVHPYLTTSMFQDIGFHWASNADNYTNHSPHESNAFPKHSDLSNLEDFRMPSTSYSKHEQQCLQDLNDKLLKTFYSGCQINGTHLSNADFYSNPQSSSSLGNSSACGRGSFSRIHPSTDISSFNQSSSPSPFSSSFGMNLQALDLLASAKFGGNFGQPTFGNFSSHKEGSPLSPDHLTEANQGLSNNSRKMSFMNGVTETKRIGGISEPKPCQAATKKPRFESRSSFPPFKVRKEKLGDRIAALQQLVAPFGKTDTASVLLEAIGYIKFLQRQVETLSVPYMKSSGNNGCRTNQGGSSEQDGNEEPKRDLRSRGLCLVPLSCTSYVTNDNGGVWSPPNFST